MNTTMTEFITIPCPHCHTLNRVPANRRSEGGKCGRCHAPLFSDEPIDLDTTHFDQHAKAEDMPLLVDFWAAWCGPCRAMAPVFAGVAGEFGHRLRFARVDADAESRLAKRYNIQALPTMILFRGGRELARHSGAMHANALRSWVKRHVDSETQSLR
jgi:thioredoxin 2